MLVHSPSLLMSLVILLQFLGCFLGCLAQTTTTRSTSSTSTTRTTTTTALAPTIPTALPTPPAYATSLASSLSLTQSTALPYPTASIPVDNSSSSTSPAASWILKNWDISGKVSFGAGGIGFVADPTTSGTGEKEVLQVQYPAGSYSKGTGGTQFYSTALTLSPPAPILTTLLTYSLYIPPSFDFNMGGKLPGLRGGSAGCSGGNETDGTTCFSTRLMWRANGVGEIYAYIPTTPTLCASPSITCNSDFGTSISRGAFQFQRGEWNDIALAVRMNSPSSVANGGMTLWVGGKKVIDVGGLRIRTADSLMGVGGMFFSTFFGGDDSTWASPTLQSTYFRDIYLFGSSLGSTSTATTLSIASASATIGLPTTTSRVSGVKREWGWSGWVVAVGCGVVGWVAVF